MTHSHARMHPAAARKHLQFPVIWFPPLFREMWPKDCVVYTAPPEASARLPVMLQPGTVYTAVHVTSCTAMAPPILALLLRMFAEPVKAILATATGPLLATL